MKTNLMTEAEEDGSTNGGGQTATPPAETPVPAEETPTPEEQA